MSSYCEADVCAAFALSNSVFCQACLDLQTKSDKAHGKAKSFRVGLVYDPLMCGHEEEGHPECPERITSIFDRLRQKGLAARCETVGSRKATQTEILSVHSKAWLAKTEEYATLSGEELSDVIARQFNSIYMNEHTMLCALLSAGSTAEIVKHVCEGKLDSGVAVVRPPGHHAEAHCAMGFCIFNNVAIAAQMAVSHWGAKKVAIIDWDVHHGNGTQNMFIDSKSILYFSVHRYDNGGFYPGSNNGGPHKVGQGEGQGYNVNVGWNDRLMGDEHYKLCFQHVVVPILTDFAPDLIIISAGFDAARGDPLGGCDITPAGYAALTSMLAPFGKIVMVLEGGYNLNSISESFAACTEVLLGDTQPVVKSSILQAGTKLPPFQKQRLSSCVKSILETIKFHSPFWPSLVTFSTLLKEYEALVECNSDLKKEILSEQSKAQALVDAITEGVSKVHLAEENKDKPAATETKEAKSTAETTEAQSDDSGVAQEGFGVQARNYCPHVAKNITLPLPSTLPLQCHACDNKKENWVCLSCHLVACGRHAQGHMAAHVETTGHIVALGFDDLSFWCYQCDNYLHHLQMERVFQAYSQMCEIKFGEKPPAGLFQGQKSVETDE